MSQNTSSQKKKWLSNAILASFLILVATTAFLSDLLKTPVKSHNEFIEQSLVFNNKELENITRLSLKNKSGEYIFERIAGENQAEWRMVSPKSVSTASVFIEKLFSTLKVIKTKKLLIDDQSNNSNFSLDKPTAILTLNDEAQKTIILSFGIMNTIDNSTYLKISGKTGIYHVEAPSISLENITLADLVESTVFDVKIADIASFKIFKKNSSVPQFEIFRKEGNWMSAEEKVIDSVRAEDLLDDFIVLKSTHIIETPNDAQNKQIQKLISPSEYTVKVETVKNESFLYRVSPLTKQLIDVPLNDEDHFVIVEGHTPTVYVIKKDAQTLFEVKNENLKSLEIGPQN